MPAFDLTLFGATGFTGKLVAEYLAEHSPPHLRLALAGRRAEALEAVRAALPRPSRFELALASSEDPSSLEALARQTRVLLTTVGPYARHGLPVAAAAADAGIGYVDLTGEVHFIRRSIDALDARARATGARLVHSCGFDSIPSDLGTWLVHHHAQEPLVEVTCAFERASGGFSGGTVASLLAAVEEATQDRALRRLLADPYSLSPDRAAEPELGRQADQLDFKWDPLIQQWTAPFFMAPINTRVVRRSNSLLGHAYGKELRYREVIGTGPGLRGAVIAAVVTGVIGAGLAAIVSPLSRPTVKSFLPGPGEGPSRASIDRGHFRVRLTGLTRSGKKVEVLVKGVKDPGYGETAKMISQAALCLALDEQKLPRVTGVLTPAVAFGGVLVDRLRAAGMTWEARTL